MKFHFAHSAVLSFAFAVAALSSSGGAFAVDEEAAKALMKTNDCTKCHAADKDKVGPSYKNIAAKYKGKADAEAAVTKVLTTGAKSSGGSEAPHKIINTKDAKEIKNVVQWVLAQ